jgi:hypothetical protein
MSNITMHLTANFYPPIPHDIQLRVQEIFDELVMDSDPYILGWKDSPEYWEYEVSDDSVFDREYELPNGRTVTGQSLMDDLRLWEALWWDCEEPDEFLDIEDEEEDNQLSLFHYSEDKWVAYNDALI